MTADEFKTARVEYTQHSIPKLIEMLSSDKLRVRFFAEMALRDATST